MVGDNFDEVNHQDSNDEFHEVLVRKLICFDPINEMPSLSHLTDELLKKHRVFVAALLYVTVHALHLLEVMSNFQSAPEFTPNMGPSSQSTGTSTSRGTKRKSHLIDIVEDHYDKITIAIGALAKAVKDGISIFERQQILVEQQISLVEKQISLVEKQVQLAKRGLTILEQSRARHYSESDVWAMLGEVGVSQQFKRVCYKYLIKHEDKKREVFGVPADERLHILLDIMLEAGLGPQS